VDRGPGTVASPPPAEGRSDDELVQAYLAGDKTAFGHLVIKHRWSVHLTCLRVLNDHQEAQDQMQNTFEKAFRAKAARYRGRCEFGAWLRTIAEHESRNAVRARDMRQAKAMWEGRDQSERGARDPGEMTVARITIAEALAQLPAEFRETVLNVYQRGLTKQEAGKVEGISPSTVGSRCTRAKALLAEYLQEAGNH
jgi:RNA polymerase sigma-70 factor (ECF subfamily)